MNKKIIVLSAMHGRNDTVKYCLDKMPFVDVVMIYSTDQDGEFLKGQDVFASGQFENDPLSFKWNAGVMSIEQLDFDAVILLGSDDYIDTNFLQYVKDNIEGHDMICFTDIYFEDDGLEYYWSGYEGTRKGEPTGAGKVYTKEFLKRINWNLFHEARNRGLDGVSWRRCKEANAKIHKTTLKENNLLLVDVKDGKGMTKISSLNNLVKSKK